MSKLKTRCVHCDRTLLLTLEALGKRVRCSHCQGVFEISNVAPLDNEAEAAEPDVLVTRSQPTPATAESPRLAGPAPRQPVVEQASSQELTSSSDRPSAAADTPRFIGRYQIKRELGRGAFGVVYAAYDDVLQREVALKLCNRERMTSEQAGEDRLLSEARAVARLRHPNIVAVFEAGIHEHQVFIVSELVTGETLADRIQAGNLLPRDAALLVRDLARGLDYAHQQNLVHRDIKPRNVLIDADGNRPQITDFGLAFDRSNEEEFREQAYAHSGTLAYMAPEQAGITGISVGPAADQYALGATLFELITGQRPHQGNSLEVLQGLEAKHPPRARAINTSIDVDLDAICYKAMAHEAWRRYEDCEQLARDLERYLAGDLIKGRRVGVIERARHFSKRNPQVAAWMAAAAAIILAALAYTTTSAVSNVIAAGELAAANAKLTAENAQQAQQNAQSSNQLLGLVSGPSEADSQTAPKQNVAATRDPQELAGWVAYSRKLHKASRSLAVQQFEHGRRLIGETIAAYRDWEHRFLEAASGQAYVSWPLQAIDEVSNAAEVHHLIQLPDPTWIGVHSGSQLSVRDLASGAEVVSTVIDYQSTQPSDYQFFPLSKEPVLAFADGSTIRFWDYRQSRETRTFTISGAPQILAMSSDDRWLLIQTTTSSGRSTTPGSTTPGSTAPGSTTPAPPPHKLQLWDVKQGKSVVEFSTASLQRVQPNGAPATAPASTNNPISAVASADAKFFLIGAANALFRLSLNDLSDNAAPPNNRPPELTRLPIEGVARLLCMASDHSGCLYVDDQGKYRHLSVLPYGGQQSTLLTHQVTATTWNTRITSFLKTSGEALFAVNDGQQITLHSSDGQFPLGSINSTGDYIAAPVFSSDGRFLTAFDGQAIQVWDLAALQPSPLSSSYAMVASMAQSSDGSLAAIAYADGRVDLWSLESNRTLWTVPGDYSQSLNAIVFHPTQPVIAVGGSHGIVAFRNVSNGEVVNNWPALPTAITALQFSPDGETLAIGLSQSQPRSEPHDSIPAPAPAAPVPIEVSAVGTAQGRLVSFQNSQAIAAQLQPDANLLLFATQSRQPIGQFNAHQAGVKSVAFSPDGTRVASSGEDGRVALWDVNAASAIAEYTCQPGGIPGDLEFSPNGQRLAFVVQSGAIKLVPVTMTRTLVVTKCRVEERMRELTVWNKATVQETVTRDIDYEGTAVQDSRQVAKTVPIAEQKTQTYTVSVPYTETIEQTYTAYRKLCVQDPQSQLLPHVVAAQANDLSELARWYPEGSATPDSLAFAADGNRLYVSTDTGISSLHPELFFELVELKPTASRSVAQGFGSLLFSERHNQLLAAGSQAETAYSTVHAVYALRHQHDRQAEVVRLALRQRPLSAAPAIDPNNAGLAVQAPVAKIDDWSGEPLDLRWGVAVDGGQSSVERLASLAAVPANATSAVLSRVRPTQSNSTDLLNEDRPFTSEGVYEAGDYLPAPGGSLYRYDIPDGWSSFHTLFALGGDAPTGAAVFVVRGDGQTLYRSPIVRDAKLHAIRLDIRGIKRLELATEYVDRGRGGGTGAWITPEVSRRRDRPSYALEFDEIRIAASELDYCEIQLSRSGFKLNELRYTDPTFRVNGVAWNPKSANMLPNQGATKFVSDSADFSLARVHALRIGDGGNLNHQISNDGVTLRFTRPANGSTDFECVIQIPRGSRAGLTEEESMTQALWAGPWKVAGFAIPETADQPIPSEIPIKEIRPFAIADMEAIDWSWPEERTSLANTPQNRYAVVGQRQLRTEGGHFRIETLGDDAVRVRVNGELVVDDWSLGGVRQNAVLLKLPKGTHTIRCEQFKPEGRSRLYVSVQPMEKVQLAPSDVARSSLRQRGTEAVNLDERTQEIEPLAKYLDREIATQLRKSGVTITVKTPDGQQRMISSNTDLPPQPFVLVSLWDGYSHAGRFGDETLKMLDEEGMLSELETVVSLSNTLTADGLSCLRNKRSLVELRLGARVREETLVGLLSTLPNVHTLQLNNTLLTDVGMQLIGRLPLRYLAVGATQITDVGLQALQGAAELTDLNLSRTQVSEQGLMQVLPRLEKLRSIHLDDLPVTDRTLEILGQLPITGTLSLRNTAITDAGISKLKDRSIWTINLSGTAISDEGMQQLQPIFQGLRSSNLALDGTKITDQSLSYLETKSCYNLDLSNTQVTDRGIESLKKLEFVQYLTLRDTQVTEAAIQELKQAFPTSTIRN